jgi:hypothetical protein
LRDHGKLTDEYRAMRRMLLFYWSYFNRKILEQEMASLGLITSIDRVIHGKSLLKHFIHK